MKNRLKQNGNLNYLFNQFEESILKFDSYLNITNDIWNIIIMEWLNEEYWKIWEEKTNWKFIKLKISDKDINWLKELNDSIINKYNSFDIFLKEKYNLKFVDLVNYDKWEIIIVSCLLDEKLKKNLL